MGLYHGAYDHRGGPDGRYYKTLLNVTVLRMFRGLIGVRRDRLSLRHPVADPWLGDDVLWVVRVVA